MYVSWNSNETIHSVSPNGLLDSQSSRFYVFQFNSGNICYIIDTHFPHGIPYETCITVQCRQLVDI